MIYTRINKLTAQELAELMHFCYEHSEHTACILCRSKEEAERLTDGYMQSFHYAEIPGVEEIGWYMQKGHGEIKFSNKSCIFVISESCKQELLNIRPNWLLYQPDVSEKFLCWAKNRMERYEFSVSDAFSYSPNEGFRHYDEIEASALDEFLASFKTTQKTVAPQR